MHLSSLLRFSLLIAATVSPWLAAAEEGHSDVIELTSGTFEAETQNVELMLVEFFAPWCGHCKALAPHYEEAATALKEKDIKLAKVDCVAQADLCAENKIQGYPTLKVFKKGKSTDYAGPRQADGIISYMIKQSLPSVSTVTSDDYEEFKVADKVVLLAYVTSTEDAPIPVFSSVADSYRDKYLFGLTTDEAAAKEAGVKPPAIVLYKKFDEGRDDFPSDKVTSVTDDSLIEWINSNAIPLIDEVSGENYNHYVNAGLPLAFIFVESTDPKKEELIKELTPIAREYKGAVNFVWINAATYGEHAKSLVLPEAKWPSFAIQDLKGQHKYPLDQSLEVNSKTIRDFVKKLVDGKLEPTLKSEPIPEEQTEKYYQVVGHTFEKVVYDDSKDVFLQLSAPWCGHCKRLLPTWESLGEVYADQADRLTIAKMDGSENDLPVGTPFQITGFPTIKFKPAGTREFLEYKGDRSLESLVEFVKANAKNNLTHPTNKTPEPEETTSPEVPPAPTPEVTPEEATPEDHAPHEDL